MIIPMLIVALKMPLIMLYLGAVSLLMKTVQACMDREMKTERSVLSKKCGAVNLIINAATFVLAVLSCVDLL